MDKGFIKHLKEKKESLFVVLIIGLGLVLIFLGGKGNSLSAESEKDIEERLSVACSYVDGVGECEVLVYYSRDEKGKENGKIESVMVICDGADSVEVRLRLTDMLSSFLGIGANRIRIEKKSS